MLMDVHVNPFEFVDGIKPLDRACKGMENGHTETVKVFLDAGASLKSAKNCNSKNDGTNILIEEYIKNKEEKT